MPALFNFVGPSRYWAGCSNQLSPLPLSRDFLNVKNDLLVFDDNKKKRLVK